MKMLPVFKQKNVIGWIRVGFRSARRVECRLYRLEVFRCEGSIIRTNLTFKMVENCAKKGVLFHEEFPYRFDIWSEEFFLNLKFATFVSISYAENCASGDGTFEVSSGLSPR